MERLSLTQELDIKDFNTYVGKFPGVVLKIESKPGIKEYHLATDQIIEVPYVEAFKYDKLIFGKNQEEGIVNVSYKLGKMYIYFQDGTSKTIEYRPFCLSSVITGSGKRLKGNQHYKYITSLTDDRYNELKDSWDKNFWFPRGIEEGFMILNGYTYFKGLKVNDISLLSFDIENQNEREVDRDELVVLITNTFRDASGEYTRKVFSIKEYKSSIKMVKAWCDWVRQINPDVMVGHNVFAHDLRILNLVTPLILGRDDSPIVFDSKASKFRKDGQQQYEYFNARIHGREIIDSLWMSIKYDIGRKFPSYGLKVIEKYLGLVDKDRIAWDFDKHPVRDVIKDDNLWRDFTKYAETDADSPIKMIDIMLPSLFYFNQSVPKTLQQMVNEATGSQLDSMMIRSYLQDGYSQPKTSSKVPFEGAISLGVPGIYENVKKVDCLSMYPSIMLQYQIYDKNKDPNANILKILSYFRDERVRNKKLAKSTGERYYEDLQQTQKVGANSIYGFLGAGYLLYNYPLGAAEVTRHGRDIISKATMWATGYEIIKDIRHITNEGGDNEEIQYEWKIGRKIEDGRGYIVSNIDTDGLAITNGKPTSKEEFEQEIRELNSIFPEYIKFENDGTFTKFIVVRAKNYIMLPEGETKYKLKGSSITDQKKEPALRLLLQELIECLLFDSNDNLVTVYNKYVKESQNITDMSRWANKKTITKSTLTSTRKNETKVLDALSGETYQEGDKIYLWNAIDGIVQKRTKGELDFYKDGRPKLEQNKVLRLLKNWQPGLEDKDHYLGRIYDTVCILENVINLNQFIDYSSKKNKDKIKSIIC